MSILPIITYPDKRLAQPSAKIVEVDDALKTLIADMAETMYEAPGVGLAAIQVGIAKCIIVYDENGPEGDRNYKVLINPEIISHQGETLSEKEGCLSVPEYTATVKRFDTIEVSALNMDGQPVEFSAESYEAIIIQHEIDHLNGILFIDRISSLKRNLYKRRIAKKLKSK